MTSLPITTIKPFPITKDSFPGKLFREYDPKSEKFNFVCNGITLPWIKELDILDPKLPRKYEFRVDNSMLSSFTRCERYFWYKFVQNFGAKKPAGGALAIGGWWAAFLEKMYVRMQLNQRENRTSPPELIEVLEMALTAWNECGLDVQLNSNPKKWEAFARPVSVEYLRGIFHSSMFLLLDHLIGDAKLPIGVLLMASRYYNLYGELDYKQFQIIAAERGAGLARELKLYDDNEMTIYYVVKPDLFVVEKATDKFLPVETKTVDRVKSNTHLKYKPHPQTAGYIWAGQQLCGQLGYNRTVDRCIVNVCGRMEPSAKPRDGKVKPRFMRVFVAYSPDEITEWKEVVVNKVRRIKDCLQQNNWTWNDNSCHVYAGCQFRGVDSVPPNSRHIVLASDFQVTDPWVPYDEDETEDED